MNMLLKYNACYCNGNNIIILMKFTYVHLRYTTSYMICLLYYLQVKVTGHRSSHMNHVTNIMI